MPPRVGRGGGGVPPLVSIALGLLEGQRGKQLETERLDDRAEASGRRKLADDETAIARQRKEMQRAAQLEARARLAGDVDLAGIYGTTDDAFDEDFDYQEAERDEMQRRQLARDLVAMGFTEGDARVYSRTGKDPVSERELNKARREAAAAARARAMGQGEVSKLDKQINDQEQVVAGKRRLVPTERPFNARAFGGTPIDSTAHAKFTADSIGAEGVVGEETRRLNQIKARRRDFEAMGFPMGQIPGAEAAGEEFAPAPAIGAPAIGMPRSRTLSDVVPGAVAPAEDPARAAIGARLAATIQSILTNPNLDDIEKQRRIAAAQAAVARALGSAP